MVRVKICGITREKDLAVAVASGADALGFVVGFEASPRRVSLRRAGELIARLPPFVASVLVTTREVVLDNLGPINAIGPDAIQLYGRDVTAADAEKVSASAMIRPYLVGREDSDPGEAVFGFDALLADNAGVGRPGGTGVAPDWRVCSAIRERIAPTPFILSGGLNQENVKKAIAAVGPYAVDVSSGVEASPGVKDGEKVRQFIRMVREAEKDA